MPPWFAGLGRGLVAASLLAAPVAAHMAVLGGSGASWAGWLVAVQAGAIGWVAMAAAAPRFRLLRPAVSGLLVLAALLIWRGTPDGLQAAAALPHALSYLSLLAVFAASLAPGRTPVITAVAGRMRGALSPVLLAYTRRVTIAWCVFFASQLATSLLLGLLAPAAWWSGFVNLATLPMVAAMFAAELAWRHVHHGIHVTQGTGGGWDRLRLVAGQLRLPQRLIQK